MIDTGAGVADCDEVYPVHEVFERLAGDAPDATAVVSENEELTYARLDELADRFADRLTELGVGRETRVGICAPPSLDLAVAILGVLKAGGAYVPLDPEHPAERMKYLVDDAAPRVLVASLDLTDRLPDAGVSAVPLVVLEEIHAHGPATPRTRVRLTPDDVACVIYTSGSTGSPKGVLVTHRGLVNLAEAATAEFGLRPGDRFLQLSSLTFSAFLEEFFPPLLCGATLVLEGYERAMPTIPAFLRLLAEQRIAGFEITAAYWHQLVEELTATGTRLPDSVRFVVLGCERPIGARVLEWRTFGVPLIHVYGPTETTATASYHHSGREVADPAGHVPIGRAIGNTRIHLLDRALRPVPPGAIGEVCIGGASLARGYLGAPARTAERFVPDPFGAPGARLYRTGDRARELPDGNLDFLGRVDAQIKLRGFRIEPGEVELALQQHPDVDQALVVVRDDQLVAYVMTGGSRPLDRPALREHLRALLPEYMVPGAFAVIDEIPLTVHGKIDRAALPAIGRSERMGEGAAQPPTRPLERDLAALWADVLGVEAVGVTDDLFDLGGNSLHGTRIASLVRRRLGVELTVRQLFDTRTVAGLADAIEQHRLVDGADVDVDVDGGARYWRARRTAVEETLGASLVSVSQQSLWLLSRVRPDLPLYSEAWQCRLTGQLDPVRFRAAVAETMRRHEVLRVRFDFVDGQPVQLVGADAEPPLHWHDLSDRAPQAAVVEAARIRHEDLAEPFAPARRPLFRIHLFRLAPDEHLMVFNAHHLIFDGWSVEVLLDELAAHYHGWSRPAPALQYAEFALWQQTHLRGAVLETLTGYWRDTLADAPSPLTLPMAAPVDERDLSGARLTVELPKTATDAMERDEGVTPFMVHLAVLFALLHQYTEESDICIGSPVANRSAPHVETLLGFFVNVLVLRARVSGAMSRRELLRQVRQICLDAYERAELPFDKVVEQLRPPRIPGRNPYFEVIFAYDKAPGRDLGGGLTVDEFEMLSTRTAKFELSVLLTDHGDRRVLALDYRTARYTEATARELCAAYAAELAAFAETPDAPLRPVAAQEADVKGRLTNLWQAAMPGVEITEDADFFELGGHSLLAVRLTNDIEELFGVEIPLLEFFEASTIAQVAATIEASGAATRDRPPGSVAVPRTVDDILREADRLVDERATDAFQGEGMARS